MMAIRRLQIIEIAPNEPHKEKGGQLEKYFHVGIEILNCRREDLETL